MTRMSFASVCRSVAGVGQGDSISISRFVFVGLVVCLY